MHGSEVLLGPPGADDTQAINDALATGKDVRLGPGTFTISDTLVVERRAASGSADPEQIARRSGSRRAGFSGASRVSGHCIVERLMLNGVSHGSGKTGSGRSFQRSPPHVPVAIRDMRIHGMGEAIHLENAACGRRFQKAGWRRHVGGRVRDLCPGVKGTLRNLNLDTVDGFGIHVENGEGVVCESIHVRNTLESGIRVLGGSGCRLSAICPLIGVGGPGLYIGGSQALAVDSLFVMSIAPSRRNLVEPGTPHVTLNGCCLVGNARNGLLIL